MPAAPAAIATGGLYNFLFLSSLHAVFEIRNGSDMRKLPERYYYLIGSSLVVLSI